jgi:pimeloyl-ACP methyl ester carboxylesterase
MPGSTSANARSLQYGRPVSAAVRLGRAEFAGHGIAHRVLGRGPTIAVVKPHRGPKVYEFVSVLSRRYTLVQIEPLGHGWSDRPSPHPTGGVHEQVHAVLDQEGVDRFVIWGYSAGGAMAMAVAAASDRVTAMVCGGWSPAERPNEAAMERGGTPAGQRAFWHWYAAFDWMDELGAMQIPRLVYVGTDDGPRMRGPRGIPRTRGALSERGVTVMELGGLDHLTCMAEPAFSARVGPAVTSWLDHSGAY